MTAKSKLLSHRIEFRLFWRATQLPHHPLRCWFNKILYRTTQCGTTYCRMFAFIAVKLARFQRQLLSNFQVRFQTIFHLTQPRCSHHFTTGLSFKGWIYSRIRRRIHPCSVIKVIIMERYYFGKVHGGFPLSGSTATFEVYTLLWQNPALQEDVLIFADKTTEHRRWVDGGGDFDVSWI